MLILAIRYPIPVARTARIHILLLRRPLMEWNEASRVEWSTWRSSLACLAWTRARARSGGASQPVAAGNLREEGTLMFKNGEAATEPFHKQMHRWTAVWTRLASLISRHFHLLNLSFRGGCLEVEGCVSNAQATGSGQLPTGD